ncbi:MAG: hypothetical protein KJ698_02540 [Actinobacteria bacterium]|nr:hypothetical protein [Actinomycetota bacterium]
MNQTDDRRHRSYQVGGHISRERIAREAPEDHVALEALERSDIVVVADIYDHVEWVLEALDLPHTTVATSQVSSLRLRPQQLLVIDCPGNIPDEGVRVVRRFVDGGGSLFTTDWALRHVIEAAFPGLVAYNERPTSDAVVRVEITDHDNPFLKGVMDEGDDPIWWLEGSSYPIRVLDHDRVQVLIRSRELGDQWGEDPVAVTFTHGKGEVFHMISHYYLQRTETRTRRHQQTVASYAADKGVELAPEDAAAAADLNLSEVESASSSARMIANLIAEKKKRHFEEIARQRRS